jgi:hypothetical protein
MKSSEKLVILTLFEYDIWQYVFRLVLITL